MKKPVLTIMLAVIASLSFSQTTDSLKIFQCDTLVRGLYKNHNEFLHNSPSYKTRFKSKAIVLDQDSSVLAAWPLFPTGEKKLDDAWGYCTGDEVFARYGSITVPKSFWKLESIGPYSYFMAVAADNWNPIAEQITTVIRNKRNVNSFLVVIDTKGTMKRADFGLIKKFLKPFPVLSKSFKEAVAPYEEYEYGNRREDEGADTQDIMIGIMKSYLDKLNAELRRAAK